MTPPRNESGRPWTADDVVDIDTAASVRNADRADSMPEMTTYEDEFGGEVADGYSFVTGTEWFDDCDEPVRLIRRRWVCVEEEVGTYWSSSAGLLCRQCADDFDDCPTCDGDGCDPMRGAGWVPDTEPSAVTKPPTVAYCRTVWPDRRSLARVSGRCGMNVTATDLEAAIAAADTAASAADWHEARAQLELALHLVAVMEAKYPDGAEAEVV